MPNQGPNVYEVKLTALRRRQDDKGGTPDLAKRWTFVQLEKDATSAENALQKMLQKFFELHPHDVVLLPQGEKGFKEITSPAGGGAFLGEHKSDGDSYKVSNDLASLNVVKMPAMSGDTPERLTPKSDKEYSERLQKNFEVGPAYETMLVQMPSPVKGATMTATVQYKGHTYKPMYIKPSPLRGLQASLMAQMDVVVAATDLYIQKKASVSVMNGALRLAAYISDRLAVESSRGLVEAKNRFRDTSGILDDVHIGVRMQDVKSDLELRGEKEGELADVLRIMGHAKDPNDVVRGMKQLIELSPALNGETGAQASLAQVTTKVDGEDVPWAIYINRPDWEGPTYIYDVLTHMAYYAEINNELYAMLRSELKEMMDAQEEAQEEVPEELPEQKRMRA